MSDEASGSDDMIPVRQVERVVLTQFSDLLLTPENRMRDYYRRSYARMRGYYYPTHFMEIPYWIPIICSMLPDERFDRELMIVDDIDKAVDICAGAGAGTVFTMSVLDANVEYVQRLAKTGARLVLGGYTDPRDFAGFPNVAYLNEPAELLELVPGSRPVGVLDYALFTGMSCIPRFSLSTGCSFRCAFCTVPSKLVLAGTTDLVAEVRALAGLDFELVFLDDKSFGEAANWRQIERVGGWLRDINPRFKGFIVQTPPSLACRSGFLADCQALGVRYVEFGVETVSDELLKYLRKPFRLRHLHEACGIIRELGMYLIPNFIVGIPGEDHVATTDWLRDNVDIIPAVNVNWLALHYGNVRGDLGLPMHGVSDRDQNKSTKSWLNPEQEAAGWRMIDDAYAITDRYWTGRRTYDHE